MIAFTNPIKIAIAFALIIFITNLVSIFSFRKLQFSIRKVNFLPNPFFSIFKFRHNTIEYSLGWLPTGGYIAPVEENNDFGNPNPGQEKSHIDLHLYNLGILLLVFLILLFGIYNNWSGFDNLVQFHQHAYQLVRGDITAPMLIQTLQQKGVWNDFGFIFTVLFSYIFLGYFAQLGQAIKKIGWLIQLVVIVLCLAIVYVHYKLFRISVDFLDVLCFYGVLVVASAIMLGVTFLILKNFTLQEKKYYAK